MATDFLDAHQRHLADANTLFSMERYANADQLYGMAAECGLKRLMLKFGMRMNPAEEMPEKKKDKVHVNELWGRFESYRSGNDAGTDYGLPVPNPFGDWNVSQRYEKQSDFDQARVQPHCDGAEFVHDLIRKAQRDGLLI